MIQHVNLKIAFWRVLVDLFSATRRSGMIGCCLDSFEMTKMHGNHTSPIAIRCRSEKCILETLETLMQDIVSSLRTEIEVLRNELFDKDSPAPGWGRKGQVIGARGFTVVALYCCVYIGDIPIMSQVNSPVFPFAWAGRTKESPLRRVPRHAVVKSAEFCWAFSLHVSPAKSCIIREKIQIRVCLEMLGSPQIHWLMLIILVSSS